MILSMFGTRYVSVWFGNSRKLYTYKTKDRSISVNTVVLVPVGDAGEVKPAIVGGVYNKPPTDYPRNRLKTVIGVAGGKDSMAFAEVDMRKLTAAWAASEKPRRSPWRRQKKPKKPYQPYTIEEMMFYDDLFGD